MKVRPLLILGQDEDKSDISTLELHEDFGDEEIELTLDFMVAAHVNLLNFFSNCCEDEQDQLLFEDVLVKKFVETYKGRHGGIDIINKD